MIDFVNFCNVTWFYNKNKLQNKNKIFNILLKFLENVNLLFFFSAISHCFTLKCCLRMVVFDQARRERIPRQSTQPAEDIYPSRWVENYSSNCVL